VDRIKEMLDTLTELNEEQLAELQSAIVSEFETVEKEEPTPQTVDAMTSLADMLDTVRNEAKRREAQVEELASRAAEAAMRVKGEAEDAPKAEGEAEPMEEDKEAEEAPAVPAMEEEMPAAPLKPEDDKEKKPMAEASTTVDTGSELSTENTTAETPVEATPAADAAPAAEAAPEAAPATEAATTEVKAEESAPAEFTAEEAKVEAVAEEAPAVTAAADEAPVAEAVAEVAPVAEASTTTETAQTEQKEQEAPVTAAVSTDETSNIEVPADRRPAVQASAATVAITAGADIPGYTAGSEVSDMKEVASLMAKRLHGFRNVNGGNGEQHIVASFATSFPEERTLTTDVESNWAKIQAVTSPEALVASGGHAAPFEVKYDIFGLGTTARPVRDCLPKFQANRGGIRFVTPPVLSSYANAVGVWTNATDTNPGTETKLSLTVSAAAEQTVATDAVTLQMQFGNLATRAYPELIARHNELGLIQHAREAEQNLLTKIGDASTAVTTTSLIGFGRDFLVQIGRAAAAYRSRHRLEADAPLRAIIPSWVKDAMAADLALSMPGDNTLNAYGEIEGYVAARNVNLCAALDQNVFGAQSTGALVEFADSFTWYLFAEGSFLFLDGGTLDLGIVRDSTLVGTNDYKMFVETFEGVAFIGVEALKITSTISINGVAAALRDTTGGATAAAIEY
jgi:chemotaxis protein histidine kinase CheA